MLSRKYKCIFIHQRKAGGTAIKSSFNIGLNDPDYQKFNGGYVSEGPAGSWQEYEKGYRDYFVFSVIRNPWDKFISGWKYCKTTKTRSLLDVLKNPPRNGINSQESHDYRHLMRLQSELLLDARGNLVTDYLIRFESLQDDFDVVCKHIGKPRCNLPLLNKTEHEDYKAYYDIHTRKMVGKIFEQDIDLFEYAF